MFSLRLSDAMQSFVKDDQYRDGPKVIGAGFGRTGTTTTKVALEKLGFGPCHHMGEVLAKDQVDFFLKISSGEPYDWDDLLSGYRATVDFPTVLYWKELMEKYPDSKIVLTVRDKEAWYKSCTQTIFMFQPSYSQPLGVRAFFSFFPFWRRVSKMMRATFDEQAFKGNWDREHAIKVYEDHIERVKIGCPPDRLLVYSVTEGWEPLCKFLGVEVPNEEFPHENPRASMTKVLTKANRVGWVIIMVTFGIVLLFPP